MPIVMALGGFVGGVQGMFKLLGGRLDSFKEEDDTFAHKETVRRTTRVPVAQTVSEIGEGRGTTVTVCYTPAIKVANNLHRHQAPWLRGAPQRENPGKVWL